jgi:hypothetical protein
MYVLIIGQGEARHRKIRGLKFAVVRRMTVQVIRLALKPELLLIGHNLLYRAWTKRGLVQYMYCTT